MTDRLPNGIPTVEEWVAALRSGNYKQADGFLRTPANGFCCLGVLCDLIDHSAWVPEYEVPADIEDEVAPGTQVPYTYGAYGDQMIEGDLAKLVSESIGLSERVQNALADANDTGREFNFIADLIEQNSREGIIDAENLEYQWEEHKRMHANP